MPKGLRITVRPPSPVTFYLLAASTLQDLSTWASRTLLYWSNDMQCCRSSRPLTLCSGLPLPDVNALGKHCSRTPRRLLERRDLIPESATLGWQSAVTSVPTRLMAAT